jgi:hypothetical protein
MAKNVELGDAEVILGVEEGFEMTQGDGSERGAEKGEKDWS